MSWAQSSWTALFLEVRIKSRALLRLVTPADVEPGSGFALVPQPILKPAGRSAWGSAPGSCTRDEGGPLAAGLQDLAAKRLALRW